MKLNKGTPDGIMSLLADGMEITGDLSFRHGLRVDGIIKGKIHSEGALIIGPQGRVEAEASLKSVSITGEFHGIIHAKDRVEILKEGKVFGDLFTPCLIIEAGAHFEGRCNMSESNDAVPEKTREEAVGAASGVLDRGSWTTND